MLLVNTWITMYYNYPCHAPFYVKIVFFAACFSLSLLAMDESAEKSIQNDSPVQSVKNAIFQAMVQTIKKSEISAVQVDGKCTRCFEAGLQSCALCLAESYCSKLCQTNHWQSHKIVCQELAAKKRGADCCQLKEELLADPMAVLQRLRVASQDFFSKLPSIKGNGVDNELLKKYVSTFKKLFALFEQRCPIFFLSECTENDSFNSKHGNDCRYDRKKYPAVRADYEKAISDALVQKCEASQGFPVACTFFAPGGLFQELIILIKTLTRAPKARLIVHLIDGKYDCYCRAADVLRPDRKRDVTEYHSLMQDFCSVSDIAVLGGSGLPIESAIFKEKSLQGCLWVEGITKQLSFCIKHMFPQALVAFQVHECLASYQEYLKKCSLADADLITAIDIQDAFSTQYKAKKCYLELCNETLRKNSKVANFVMIMREQKLVLLTYKPAIDAGIRITLNKEKHSGALVEDKAVEIPFVKEQPRHLPDVE